MEEIMKEVQIDLDNGNFYRICGNETLFKNYLKGKLDLAVSKERERVASKTDEVWELLCQMDTNVKSEKEYAKDIINLINTK